MNYLKGFPRDENGVLKVSQDTKCKAINWVNDLEDLLNARSLQNRKKRED